MATNKVVYGGTTLIDLTGDTVTADTLAEGYTAHDKAGNAIVGTAKTGGGTSGDCKVFFIDYDGTVIEEINCNIGDSVSLPTTNPDHTDIGIEFQQWCVYDNELASVNRRVTIISAAYQTISENPLLLRRPTFLHITIDKPNTEFSMYMHMYRATIGIGWGDDSDGTALGDASSSSYQTATHTYAEAGNYVIRIDVTNFDNSNSGASFSFNGRATQYTDNSPTQSKTGFNPMGSLRKVYIGDRCCLSNTIGANYGFSGCINLEEISLPYGTIPLDTTHCRNLKYFPFVSGSGTSEPGAYMSRVKYLRRKDIGSYSFPGISNLMYLDFPSGLNHYYSFFEGLQQLKGYNAANMFLGYNNTNAPLYDDEIATTLSHMSSSNGLTFLKTRVSELDLSTLPITSMSSSWKIQSNSSLFSIKLPNTLTQISASYLLKDNTALRYVDLSNTQLAAIYDYMFQSCSVLETVKLPTTCTAINKYAFNSAGVNSFDFCNVTTIGQNAFQSTKFTTVELPSTLTSIGKQVFSYLYSLTDVVVNCPLTSDAQQLFYYCTVLVNATMNTTYIPTGCFQGCRSLVNVYLPSTPPTLASSSAFPTSNTGFKLHIPAGTLSAYSSATNWSALTSYFVEDSPLS